MLYCSVLTRLIFILLLSAACLRGQQTTTLKEMNDQAEKYKARQQVINSVKQNSPPKLPVTKVLTDEGKKPSAERTAFLKNQNTPEGLRARCPQGLLIIGYGIDRGNLRVVLKNITSSNVSADGSQLRAMAYDTGLIHEVGGTSSTSIGPGETREVITGMIGSTRRVGALTWKGVEIWSAPAGEVYPTGEAAIAAARAVTTALAIKARNNSLVPVKEGYVPVSRK